MRARCPGLRNHQRDVLEHSNWSAPSRGRRQPINSYIASSVSYEDAERISKPRVLGVDIPGLRTGGPGERDRGGGEEGDLCKFTLQIFL